MLVIWIFLIVAFSGAAKEGIDTGTEVFVYESHMPFLFSMIFMIAEAIVGSMFDGSSNMHWVAQFIHIFAEIGLLIGARGLYNKKLAAK